MIIPYYIVSDPSDHSIIYCDTSWLEFPFNHGHCVAISTSASLVYFLLAVCRLTVTSNTLGAVCPRGGLASKSYPFHFRCQGQMSRLSNFIVMTDLGTVGNMLPFSEVLHQICNRIRSNLLGI